MARISAAPAILKAAEVCLIEGGGTFEMKAVTERAEVSEGLVYHHYKSKAGLLTAIVRDYFKRYLEISMYQMPDHLDWIGREHARLSDMVEFFYNDPLTPIVFGGLSRLPEAAAFEMESHRAIAELSIHNVQTAIDQGIVPAHINPAFAGPAMIGAMYQVIMLTLTEPDPPAREKVTEELWRIVRAIGAF